MKLLLTRLWEDDSAAVISVELILIVTILVFGLIPGLVALRNSGIAVMTTMGNLANALIPSFTFSGFQIVTSGGTVVGQVNGVSFSPNPGILTGAQQDPISLPATVVVPPAP